jgi:hypothetical protein
MPDDGRIKASEVVVSEYLFVLGASTLTGFKRIVLNKVNWKLVKIVGLRRREDTLKIH